MSHPIPEPSAWAMLLIWFAGIGFVKLSDIATSDFSCEDHSWNPHALTVANVAPAPSAGPLTTIAVLMALAAMQGMNSSSIGRVFGTVAAAANVGKPNVMVPPIVPVMVTDVAGLAA